MRREAPAVCTREGRVAPSCPRGLGVSVRAPGLDVAGVWGGGRHHQDAVCWEVDGSGREPGGVREGGRCRAI